jgi:hypothetical protein
MPPQTRALVGEYLAPCLAELVMAYFCPTNPSYRDYGRYGVVEMCRGPRRSDFFLGACEGDEPTIAQMHFHDMDADWAQIVYDHRSMRVAACFGNKKYQHPQIGWMLDGPPALLEYSWLRAIVVSACKMGRRHEVIQHIKKGLLDHPTWRVARSTAIMYGHIELALDIITHIGGENPTCGEGIYAHFYGDERLIGKLRIYGVQCAMYGACLSGRLDIVEALLPTCGVRRCKMYYACMGGHVHIIHKLISVGEVVEEQDMRVACQNGHLAAAEVLLSRAPRLVQTGLEGACIGGYQQLIDKMAAAGADPARCSNCKGRFHVSPS